MAMIDSVLEAGIDIQTINRRKEELTVAFNDKLQ